MRVLPPFFVSTPVCGNDSRAVKIRLQRGSVRFRLRQGDVKSLVDSGRADEPVRLGGAEFVSTLQLGEGPASLRLDGARLVASIPAADARPWAAGNEVGLYYTMPEGTRLLVEKDWACLEPAAGESNDGAFPRPDGGGR